MSCSVFAIPYALAYVVAAVVTGGIDDLSKDIVIDEEEEKDTGSINNCEDIHIISEKTFIEKSFETPFMDKEILMKTISEHGLSDIKEDEYGVISGRFDNYSMSFSKMEADKPYFVKISCLNTDNAEEKIQDLSNEYTLNVQEDAYLNIIEKIKENNMEIEDEEVLDDNTIVLTVNLE